MPVPLEERMANSAIVLVIVYGLIFFAGLVVLVLTATRRRDRGEDWEDALRDLLQRPWLLGDVGRVVVPLVAAHLVFLGILSILFHGKDPDDLNMGLMLVLQSLVFHWLGLGLIVWRLRAHRVSLLTAFGIDPERMAHHAKIGFLAILGTMPILLGANVLYQLFLQMVNLPTDIQDVTRIIADTRGLVPRLYLGMLAVVIAPVVEEVLFRGILLPALAKAWHPAGAVAVVSALFALIHGHIPSFLPLFILSCALCLAAIRFRSLTIPIVMHSLFNALTVTMVFAMPS